MEFIKCFDVLKESINEATESLGDEWAANEDKIKTLELYCERIDKIVADMYGESISVEIDLKTRQIEIVIENEVLDINFPDDTFCEILKNSIKFSFRQTTNGALVQKYVFEGVWEKR